MAETIIKNLFIGGIIFTLCVVGFVSLIASWQSADPSFSAGDDVRDFNRLFNKTNELQGNVTKLKEQIENTELDLNVLNVLNILFNVVWQGLKTFFGTIGFMFTVLLNAGIMFGIPEWFTGLLISLITVLVILSMWAIIFNRDV